MRALAAVSLLLFATVASAGDRIVVITDSHGIGSFGTGIEAWLRARPYTDWDFFAAGGSSPAQWTLTRWTTPCGFHETAGGQVLTRKCYELKVPHLSELWAAQPVSTGKTRRVTVIAHGSNYRMDSKASEVANTVALIKDAFAASDVCIWVGPPNMKRSPGFDAAGVAYKYGIIQAGIASVKAAGGGECALIDSRKISTYPKEGGDGIHYHWLKTKDPASLAEGPKWAAAVGVELDALLP